MFWRHRKVLRDRAAGMVFDWRRGHGSTSRMIIAVIVATCFWGALLAYVQISDPDPPHPIDDQIDLTMVDLDARENRWLAELIDRETLFHRRWDVRDPSAIETEVVTALALKSPRTYEPTLREIILPGPDVSLVTLPGRGPTALPDPDRVDSVIFASPPVNWWVDVRVVEGPDGLAPFSFPWPDSDPGREMSEGEIWTVLIGVDWQGRVLVNEPTIKSSNSRTPVLLKKYRALKIAALPEKSPLRWWKLEARLANRPLPE
ncbi:MAG: hypothetical protein ACI9NQ_000356 [Paracoccaceae bacterium]|jgi:hypothetical protein